MTWWHHAGDMLTHVGDIMVTYVRFGDFGDMHCRVTKSHQVSKSVLERAALSEGKEIRSNAFTEIPKKSFKTVKKIGSESFLEPFFCKFVAPKISRFFFKHFHVIIFFGFRLFPVCLLLNCVSHDGLGSSIPRRSVAVLRAPAPRQRRSALGDRRASSLPWKKRRERTVEREGKGEEVRFYVDFEFWCFLLCFSCSFCVFFFSIFK